MALALQQSTNRKGVTSRHAFDEIIKKVGAVKPIYQSFDEYAKDYPAGENFRVWITAGGNRPKNEILIFPGTGPHDGLPGGFLWASITHYLDAYGISVHDCDDGLMQSPPMNYPEAKAALADLAALCPFDMGDLTAFYYQWG